LKCQLFPELMMIIPLEAKAEYCNAGATFVTGPTGFRVRMKPAWHGS
jgi:hypothetical protein